MAIAVFGFYFGIRNAQPISYSSFWRTSLYLFVIYKRDPWSAIMRIYLNYLGMLLLRRSQETTANRDTNNIQTEYIIRLTRSSAFLDEILSHSFSHCFVSGIRRIFLRFSPAYLPHDHESAFWRILFPYLFLHEFLGNAQRLLHTLSSHIE